MSDHQLKAHIEKPDATYIDPETGAKHPSSKGLVWYPRPAQRGRQTV